MERIALIIDAQKDFMSSDGALYVPGAEKVTKILNQYLPSITLENGYFGVIFTADTHDKDTYADSEEAKMFPPHCILETDGFNFNIDMSQIPENTKKLILNKSVFNMWEEEDLILRPYKTEGEIVSYAPIPLPRNDFFDNLISAGINQIEVSGVASDYCVKEAIYGLLIREFNVKVYDNLVAGIERDIHQVAKEEFGFYLGNGQLVIE